MSTAAELSSALKSVAKDLGFDLVGIAPAVTPVGFTPLQAWLERGYAGEMLYLSRRRAAYEHPRHVLDGVRYIVMVAVNYHGADREPPSPDDLQPCVPSRVAQYARGARDYHDVLKEQLQQLAAVLHERSPGCRTRTVVDTAPLLERDFAQQAGLGWFGKNTMLIHKQAGSFLLLGALLTDVELEPDEPHHTSHCGTCTRCLDVCPTDAFPEPYVLDARRCISYLTIELKSPIPRNLRSGVGDWLFGCDLCQDVCPWNRKPAPSTNLDLMPQDDLNPADALGILTLTAAEFRSRFCGTPLDRPGYDGLRRNAAIVLGNCGDPQAIPSLISVLADASPVVRGAAAWALGQLGGHAAATALQARHLIEDNPQVIEEIEATRLASSPPHQ